jgi:hypothetical protein
MIKENSKSGKTCCDDQPCGQILFPKICIAPLISVIERHYTVHLCRPRCMKVISCSLKRSSHFRNCQTAWTNAGLRFPRCELHPSKSCHEGMHRATD